MKKILAFLLSVLMLTSLAVFPAVGEAADPLADYMAILGHQVTVKPTGTDGNDKLYAIRIVAAHENLEQYSSFGYNVSITYTPLNATQETTKTLKNPVTSSFVYKTLSVSGGESIKASEYEVDYISGIEIKNVPASAGDLKITVTPFVTLLNGTQVDGNATEIKHAPTVTTMTFNIRNWEQQTNNHLQRLILTIKEANYPDVIGFQEMGTSPASWDWRALIMEDTDIAACYNWYGVSRADNTAESCIIFYKKDKFELIESESGTRWLYCDCANAVTTTCTCMGKTTAGNLLTKADLDLAVNGVDIEKYGNDNDLYNRILTYAKLKRKSDNKEFYFFNTHLEINGYAKNKYGAYTIQNKQIQYILNFAKTLTDEGCPVILTGDFNASTGSTVVDSIIDTAGFSRAQTAAYNTVGAEVPSSSTYKYCGNGTTTPYQDIDHVFIYAPNDVFVRQYTFCDQPVEYGGSKAFASDHIPRIAEYIIW